MSQWLNNAQHGTLTQNCYTIMILVVESLTLETILKL